MTGLSRQQAAEAVAALFGATAIHSRSSRTYDPWEVTDNEGKTWRFVFDASIRATHRSGRRQLSTGSDAATGVSSVLDLILKTTGFPPSN